MTVTFEFGGNEYVMPEAHATLFAVHLRGYAVGNFDAQEISTLPGVAPGWLDGAIPLADAIEDTLTAQIVSLRGAQFDRYLDLSAHGVSGRESVYALPTTVGTVLGVCLQGSGGTSFASTCERIVGSIKLASGSVLGIGPSASYASGLSAAITQLNAARSAPASQLRNARVPATQATAAAALATAYLNAASAVTRLQAGTAQSANLAVAGALRSTGNAYAALGRAAASSDATGYASATNSVTVAQSALSAAFSQLAKLGYVVG